MTDQHPAEARVDNEVLAVLHRIEQRMADLEDQVGRNAAEVAKLSQAQSEKLDLIDEALAGWTEDIERTVAEADAATRDRVVEAVRDALAGQSAGGATASSGGDAAEAVGAALRTELLGARLAMRSLLDEAVAAQREALSTRELSPAEIAAAVGEVVPAAMASSLSQLVQSSFEAAESSRATMIEAIRKDLIALASTIKSATDAAARTVGEQATQAASAAADAAERSSTAAAELASAARVGNAGGDLTALSDRLAQWSDRLDRDLARLGERIDSLAASVGSPEHTGAAEAITRDRVASDVTDRLSRIRDAAAGVGDAVRAEAQRRRRRPS